MLKFIFWSLLLANIGLFAYEQGYLDAWVGESHEPARMAHQFQADLMKPIPSSPVAASPIQLAATDTPANPEDAKSNASSCKEIGNFDNASAKRFESLVQPLALGEKVTHREIDEVANNIVYIPSQGSKEAADKKAAELRHLGVNDFYVIQDAGDLHWGISLGVFKTEESARTLLATLNQKGVHSARLGSHSVASTKVAYQLHNLDDSVMTKLEKIATEFPHAEMRSCDVDSNGENKPVVHAAKPTAPRDTTH